MRKFKIPESSMPGFEILRNLNQNQADELYNIVENIQIGTGPKKLQSIISNFCSESDAYFLSNTIFSFGSLLNRVQDFDLGSESLGLTLAISFSEQTNNKINEQEIKDFSSRLNLLFSKCNNLKLTYKTLVLTSENPNSFHECRVISDIRLIFNEDLHKKKRSAVILHQLKIEYNVDENTKEFYVSMDREDLISLKEQIERALEKDLEIKKSYKEIEFIEITE